MKVQLWMRGKDEKGAVRLYKTVTGEEFAQVLAVVLANDGQRPWEKP